MRWILREDLAVEVGLTTAEIESYETDTNRLSVSRYWTVMSVLGQDPIQVLQQLKGRLLVTDAWREGITSHGLDFVASNPGRQLLNALAMWDDPKILNALADLILSVGVHSVARAHPSREHEPPALPAKKTRDRA